jgi:hypothetical protein
MTTMSGINARDRRTLLYGAIVIGTLTTLARGVPAVRSWNTARQADAGAAVDQAALAHRATRLLPVLRDSLRQRRARLAALDSVLIVGSSASVVTAGLASALEDIADDAQVRISVLQMHADTTTRSGLTRVTVRMTGIADVAGLAAFLHAVEGGERYLAVRELAVSQPEPAAADSKPEMLRLDILVEGLGLIRAGVHK